MFTTDTVLVDTRRCQRYLIEILSQEQNVSMSKIKKKINVQGFYIAPLYRDAVTGALYMFQG